MFRNKFIILCGLFLLICMASVSANENTTIDSNETILDTPTISIDSTSLYSKEPINIYLRDSNNTPISHQNLTAKIDENEYPLLTDSKGKSSLSLNLKSNSYVLDVMFKGNDVYSPVNKTFNITVLKRNSTLNPINTTVIRGNYLQVVLKDHKGNLLKEGKVIFTINGKNYEKITNSKGIASQKIALVEKEYPVQITFEGNDYYNRVSINVNLVVIGNTSMVIGNDRLLSNGYIRIYLRSDIFSTVANKNVIITVGKKKFNKTTNSEGIIIFKPKVGTGTFKVTAVYEGTSLIIGSNASKTVNGIEGSVKNPLSSKIPLKNGVPDIDLMSAKYVMADEDAKYTLLKDQYKEVIKRDSYCLYLYNKLSKYTFFKTKTEPKIKHIIKREKWNVIERELNTKVVKKNKIGYWPSQITVKLKDKSYTYAEVRDEQNTDYTCGPTSCSMCSQVLRNYICEKQLTKQGDADPYWGSSTKGLKKSLEKNNFKCSIYYKSSFDAALNKLKKGGCALVFHTWNHFVCILDISKDGKMILVGNPSGDYEHGSHKIPTKWLTVEYMKGRFNDYDTSGLIVKLKYSLNKKTKTKLDTFYSSMGTKWTRQNTSESIPQIGK